MPAAKHGDLRAYVKRDESFKLRQCPGFGACDTLDLDDLAFGANSTSSGTLRGTVVHGWEAPDLTEDQRLGLADWSIDDNRRLFQDRRLRASHPSSKPLSTRSGSGVITVQKHTNALLDQFVAWYGDRCTTDHPRPERELVEHSHKLMRCH